MGNRLRRLARDERGMSLVYICVGFMAFLTATTLAIDVGMFMTARSQSQNSADGGALAVATALAFDSFTVHTATGPAVLSALDTSRANKVISQTVSVGPTNVEFLNGPAGIQNRVKVTVFRDSDHGSSIPTLMGQFFGVSTFSIFATATAEASPAN